MPLSAGCPSGTFSCELDSSESQEALDTEVAPWDSWEGLPLTKDLKEATPAAFLQTWWAQSAGTEAPHCGPLGELAASALHMPALQVPSLPAVP